MPSILIVTADAFTVYHAISTKLIYPQKIAGVFHSSSVQYRSGGAHPKIQLLGLGGWHVRANSMEVKIDRA